MRRWGHPRPLQGARCPLLPRLGVDVEPPEGTPRQGAPRQLGRRRFDNPLEPDGQQRADVGRSLHRPGVQAVETGLLEGRELARQGVVVHEVERPEAPDRPAKPLDGALAQGATRLDVGEDGRQASATWARKPARLRSRAAPIRASASARYAASRARRARSASAGRELDPLGSAEPQRVRPPEEVELPAQLGEGRSGRRDAREEDLDERGLVAGASGGAPGRRRGGLPLGRHRGPVGRIGLEERRHARVEAHLAAAELALDLGGRRREDEAAAIGQGVAQTLERVPRLADDRRERMEGLLRDEPLPPEGVVRGDARRIETEVGGAKRRAPGPEGDVELEKKAGGSRSDMRHSPRDIEIEAGTRGAARECRASCASARSRTRRTVAAETRRRPPRGGGPAPPSGRARTGAAGPAAHVARGARDRRALAASTATMARSSGVAPGIGEPLTTGPGTSSSCPSSVTTVSA